MKCANCGANAPPFDFYPMRLSIKGVSLFCCKCMDLLKNSEDFWLNYAMFQNEDKRYLSTKMEALILFTKPGLITYPKFKIDLPQKPPPRTPRKPMTPRKRMGRNATISTIKKPIREPPIVYTGKQVIVYNLKNVEVGRFDSIFIASDFLNIATVSIAKVIDTKDKLSGLRFVLE